MIFKYLVGIIGSCLAFVSSNVAAEFIQYSGTSTATYSTGSVNEIQLTWTAIPFDESVVTGNGFELFDVELSALTFFPATLGTTMFSTNNTSFQVQYSNGSLFALVVGGNVNGVEAIAPGADDFMARYNPDGTAFQTAYRLSTSNSLDGNSFDMSATITAGVVTPPVKILFEGHISSMQGSIASALSIDDNFSATLVYYEDFATGTDYGVEQVYDFPYSAFTYSLDVQISTFSGSGADGQIKILNDYSGRDWFQTMSWPGSGFSGDSIAGSTWTQTTITLKDYEEVIFNDTSLPSVIPSLSEYEEAFGTMYFSDGSLAIAEITSITEVSGNVTITESQSVDLSAGTPVELLGGTATGGIDLSFGDDFSGEIVVTPSVGTTANPPTFSLPNAGEFQVWDIEVVGSFSGTAELTFSYDEATLIVPESELVIFHYSETSESWEALPTVVDEINNLLIATTNSFSPFAMGVAQNSAPIANAGSDLAIASLDQNQTIIHGTATDQDEGDEIQYRWLEGTYELAAWKTIETGSDADLDLGTVLDYPIGEYTLTLEVSDGEVITSDSMILKIEANPAVFKTKKVKVCWHHDDIHVEGEMILPEIIWMYNLTPIGYANLFLADVLVTEQEVEFEIKGKNSDKWEYKDKDHINGNIKEFKIDWKGSKFDYHGDLHLHTHFISSAETSFCIHTDKVSGAFTVDINGVTIVYDENNNITTDVEYEQQKDDNSHVHFVLPFQLTSDMAINITGAVENTINVEHYFSEGYGKFKIVSSFNSDVFPNGTDSTPDIVDYGITLGDNMTMVFDGDAIGDDEAWEKKDDKHWEYKLKK